MESGSAEALQSSLKFHYAVIAGMVCVIVVLDAYLCSELIDLVDVFHLFGEVFYLKLLDLWCIAFVSHFVLDKLSIHAYCLYGLSRIVEVRLLEDLIRHLSDVLV